MSIGGGWGALRYKSENGGERRTVDGCHHCLEDGNVMTSPR